MGGEAAVAVLMLENRRRLVIVMSFFDGRAEIFRLSLWPAPPSREASQRPAQWHGWGWLRRPSAGGTRRHGSGPARDSHPVPSA